MSIESIEPLAEDGEDIEKLFESTAETSAILLDADAFASRGGAINLSAIELEAKEAPNDRLIIKLSYSTNDIEQNLPARQTLLNEGWVDHPCANHEALRLEIAIAAVRIADRRAVDQIIFVTDDELLRYVVESHLKSNSLRVKCIGVGKKRDTTDSFIRAFDSFRYYDDIDQPLNREEIQRDRQKFANSWVFEAYKLKEMGWKPVNAQIVPALIRRHPGFTPQVIGFHNFRQLAEFAANDLKLVHIESSGSDFEVVDFTAKGIKVARDLNELEQATTANEAELTAIKEAIKQLIQIDLPNYSTRKLIFTATGALLGEGQAAQGISLIELSYKVKESISGAGISQNTIYRLLNGLYRVGAFSFRPNNTNRNDPLILGTEIPVSNFDEAFTFNLLSQSNLPSSISPESLAKSFYGSPEKVGLIEYLKEKADGGMGRKELKKIIDKMPKKLA